MSSIPYSTISDVPSVPVANRATTRRWIDYLLVGFMLINLALSLDAAQWSPGLDRLFGITVMAFVAGALVASSHFGSFFTFVYAIVTGAAAILYGLSDLATGVISKQEAAYQIIQRSLDWLENALNGQPGSDALVFVLLLAILLWILSFNATWMYFRERRKWQAILPAGLAMLVNLYYAPRDLNLYFIFYLITAMLLLLRVTLVERESAWYAQGIHFPFDIGFDVMRDGVLFILVVVMVSWVLPTTMARDNKEMVHPLQDSWKQVKAEWNRLFNTLNYGESGSASSVVFTASHPLGGARSMTNDPVMEVATSQNRYYQATILDTYTSHTWELRSTVPVNLETGYRFPTPSFSARRVITQVVTMRQVTNVLMGAPMPVSVSVPADARAIPLEMTPEEALTAARVGVSELGLILSHDLLQPGQSYTVTSAISFATESQLRDDSTVYTPAIKARYLQLPDSVPRRVFDLAEEIAADLDNPYDVAKAIETYLRQYNYNDQIPGPAPDQDAADYFLFEEKQGYCDYYATSMAVMLRTLGIPVRLVQGYATGEYDPLTGKYRLLEKDAHIWVEVFFPTYGWIQFEPTASEPVIERRSEEVTPPEDGGRASAVESRPKDQESDRNIPQPEENLPDTGFHGVSPRSLRRFLPSAGGIILTISLLGLLAVGVVLWRWVRRSDRKLSARIQKAPQDFIERLWARLLWWGRHLGVPERASLTPMEQAVIFGRAIPEAADDVRVLAQLYAFDKYSPHPLHTDDLVRARSTWQSLRSTFLRVWIHRRFRIIDQFRFWE